MKASGLLIILGLIIVGVTISIGIISVIQYHGVVNQHNDYVVNNYTITETQRNSMIHVMMDCWNRLPYILVIGTIGVILFAIGWITQ